jgi:hypothetical protein
MYGSNLFFQTVYATSAIGVYENGPKPYIPYMA